ncbi:MAG TPA: hypothetical protein VG709_02020, partial [Actinomycetota bacterium]|nr:hypothetical protein [Actinomycetota bacterium]
MSPPAGTTARRRLLPRFRATLGVKLSLVLFGVVAGALAIVYLMVVPRLESRLVDAKIRQLERPPAPLLVSHVGERAGDRVALRDAVDVASANLNARGVVFQRIGEAELLLHADSSAVPEADLTEDPVALEASATLRP